MKAPEVCPTAKLRKWARRLRKIAPPPCPVTIRRVPPERFDGETTAWTYFVTPPGHFVIEISAILTTDGVQDTLIHEFAHVLNWVEIEGISTDHDEVFWARHGQIYRAFYEEE